MPVDTPLTSLLPVRNRQYGPTVFRDAPTDTTIRWEGAGDPRGADIVEVSQDIYAKPAFQVMVRKGLVALVSEEEYISALSGEAPAVDDALAAQAADAIHRPQVNDLMGVPCIGPGSRPGTTCTSQVPVRQSEKDLAPPLCDAHKFMAGEYVATETIEGEKLWSRAVMGERRTEQPTA